jgi:hypothetical protein
MNTQDTHNMRRPEFYRERESRDKCISVCVCRIRKLDGSFPQRAALEKKSLKCLVSPDSLEKGEQSKWWRESQTAVHAHISMFIQHDPAIEIHFSKKKN